MQHIYSKKSLYKLQNDKVLSAYAKFHSNNDKALSMVDWTKTPLEFKELLSTQAYMG